MPIVYIINWEPPSIHFNYPPIFGVCVCVFDLFALNVGGSAAYVGLCMCCQLSQTLESVRMNVFTKQKCGMHLATIR